MTLQEAINNLKIDSEQISKSKLSTIVKNGDKCNSAFIVERGIVRVFYTDINDEESTIALLAEGDFFPIEVIFNRSETVMFEYASYTDARLIEFKVEEFRDELLHDGCLSCSVLDGFARQNISQSMQIQALTSGKVKDKICQFMQYLVLKFGEHLGGGIWEVDIALTQEDIALLAGVTRESASTTLSKLRKDNIISYDAGVYSVDIDKLREVSTTPEIDESVVSGESPLCE
ncbi:MAG: Crp/Fnr family transcriptional regulator [Acidimicrobiia bacterium]